MTGADIAKGNLEMKGAVGKKTKYRWVVMTLLFILYTIANADRANIGFALPYLRKEFEMTNTEAGAIISLFFIGYAALQIPSGFLVKKFGVRAMFSIGMLFTSLFTGGMGLVNSVLALKALRVGIGVAEAPVAIAFTTIINNWFPPKEKGTASGIFLAGSKLGPLIVPPLCAWIILNYGWREIFYFFMIPGILLAFFWFFLVNNKPEASKFVNAAEAAYIADNTIVEAKRTTGGKSRYKLLWLDKFIRAKKVDLFTQSSQVFRSWDILGAAIGYFFFGRDRKCAHGMAAVLSYQGKAVRNYEDGFCSCRSVRRHCCWKFSRGLDI